MDRQQMIEEIQDKIADKTLSFGCVVNGGQSIYLCKGKQLPNAIVKLYPDNEEDEKYRGPFPKSTEDNYCDENIIGHPISLSRVLSSLGYRYHYCNMFLYRRERDEDGEYNQQVCTRHLTTDSGSDAYLQDQSDETIQTLHELLVRKVTLER